MRSGRNPSRRNRNIGTRASGHGSNNEHRIPERFTNRFRFYWNELANPIAVPRAAGERSVTFLVEPARPDVFHACTIDDIWNVLLTVPVDHLNGIDLIILRQPTRRQQLLSPVWGRFLYLATPASYSGTAIMLESQDMSVTGYRLPKSLSPDTQRELDRLRMDGHRITLQRRHYLVAWSPESIRATQLYRTLLHELGHYVDWLIHAIRPAQSVEDEDDADRIHAAFDAKPHQEKEAFAHRYADEHYARCTENGILPFNRIEDLPQMSADGLDPAWFGITITDA